MHSLVARATSHLGSRALFHWKKQAQAPRNRSFFSPAGRTVNSHRTQWFLVDSKTQAQKADFSRQPKSTAGAPNVNHPAPSILYYSTLHKAIFLLCSVQDMLMERERSSALGEPTLCLADTPAPHTSPQGDVETEHILSTLVFSVFSNKFMS